MKQFLLSIFTLFGLAGAAQACPDYELWGAEVYEFTGQQLYTERNFAVTAGGDNNIQTCGFSATGFFTTAPDFSLDLSGMAGHSVVVSVLSNCDSSLLVNTPSAAWFYDDDSNGQGDPRLDVGAVGDGVLDIWVGTFDGAYCDAVLYVETF